MSDLIERAYDLAGLKYQSHALHVPAVLCALADRLQAAEARVRELEAALREARFLVDLESPVNEIAAELLARIDRLLSDSYATSLRMG